jgi:hypothetical protein
MRANIPCRPKIYKPVPSRHPLRAIVEIIDGELSVLTVAENDDEERQILDAFRFAVKGWRQ